MPRAKQITVEHSELITAAPARVLGAFFDPVALAGWWQTSRSVTVPQPLGVYAVEWEPTPFRDDILGPLGGAFHGTVMEYRAAREFFVADAYWLPPQGSPLGPMALEVNCTIEGPATRLHVRQSGCEDGERWYRYYEVIGPGWEVSLRSLKTYIERGPAVTMPESSRQLPIGEPEKRPMVRIQALDTPARSKTRSGRRAVVNLSSPRH